MAGAAEIRRRQPLELDAVRPLEDEGERQARQRLGAAVAGERQDVNGIQRPVDAALGVHENIDRARRLAPGDAAVAEIEAGPRQVEKDEVLTRRVAGQNGGGRHGCGAADQARIEAGMAVGIGLRRAEDFVVARDQLELDAGRRAGAVEGAREHVEPVVAGKGRKADIAHHEPLGGAALPFLGLVGARPAHQHIDPGLALRQHLLERDQGRNLLVEVEPRLDNALPDELAARLPDAVGVIAVELLQELAIADQPGKPAIADPVQGELHLPRIDGDHRDPLRTARRQHEIVSRETHIRGAIADIGLERDRRFERLPDRRRQTLPQRQPVALAVVQAADAELAVVLLDTPRRLAVEGHIGGVIGAGFDEIVRELHADPRHQGVGVDAVVDHPEAFARLELEKGLADRRRFGQREARLICLERRPEQLAPLERLGQHRQALGAQRRRPGQAIGRKRRRGGFARQRVGLVAIGRGDRQRGPGEPDPGRRIIPGESDGAAEIVGRRPAVAGGERA